MLPGIKLPASPRSSANLRAPLQVLTTNRGGLNLQMPHIVRVRSDLTSKEALTEAQLRELMAQRYPRATRALAPSGQKRRREAVDGVMSAGSDDTAVTRNIFRGGRFVLSLLRGRETEARVLAGDLLPEPTDVLGSIRKLILSTGGVVVAQATSSSDLLLSVGGEPTLSEKNCIIEGKYDIVTLAWTCECVRRGVMLQRRYFDHVHRSARTEARLRQGRNGYLRFGLPRRAVVDVATLGNVYAEVGRQCDETERSLVGADVAAEWPDEFAASQLPGWCVFEFLCLQGREALRMYVRSHSFVSTRTTGMVRVLVSLLAGRGARRR